MTCSGGNSPATERQRRGRKRDIKTAFLPRQRRPHHLQPMLFRFPRPAFTEVKMHRRRFQKMLLPVLDAKAVPKVSLLSRRGAAEGGVNFLRGFSFQADLFWRKSLPVLDLICRNCESIIIFSRLRDGTEAESKVFIVVESVLDLILIFPNQVQHGVPNGRASIRKKFDLSPRREGRNCSE